MSHPFHSAALADERGRALRAEADEQRTSARHRRSPRRQAAELRSVERLLDVTPVPALASCAAA